MRTTRLYQDQTLACGKLLQVNARGYHHLVNVLRIKKGADVILFNGDGHQYLATVTDLGQQQLSLHIKTQQTPIIEATRHCHLGQCLAKGQKMDWIIQKAVELGVHEITPIISERCEMKLTADKWPRRHEHWHNIIIHATEQSGRTRLATLHPPCSLANWLKSNGTVTLMFTPSATQPLCQANHLPSSLSITVGPEGGFSETENQLAQDYGCQSYHLGPRILRTETCALAALTMLTL